MCSGFRHKDWEGLPGFLLAFWPCSYRSGPHLSHCCYIKDPLKFSLFIFTFVKFHPTVEWFTARKSQRAFASASTESLLLHLYLHTRFPSSSASCPVPGGRPCAPAFAEVIKQRHGKAGGSRQAGEQAGPCPLRTHNLLPSLPPLPRAPRCSLHSSLSARSSATRCPATFSVLSSLPIFWPCLFRSDFSARLGCLTPLRLGRVKPLAPTSVSPRKAASIPNSAQTEGEPLGLDRSPPVPGRVSRAPSLCGAA